MHTALRALRLHISPEWAEWNEPDGGFLIWLELKGTSLSSAQWMRLFAANGVRPLLGNQFFNSAASKPCLRLSISMLSEDEISEGIRRLSAALRQAYGGGKRIAVSRQDRRVNSKEGS